VAAAKENRHSAALDAAARQDEIVFRTAELFLDAQKACSWTPRRPPEWPRSPAPR